MSVPSNSPLHPSSAGLAAPTIPSPRDPLPALRQAASGSRTPFTTLVAIAVAESNIQADAKHPKSSASGAFQITNSTWLELVKRYGAAAGRPDLAALVTTDTEGRATVAPENRSKVLEARKDVDLSAKLTARLCDENRAGLTRKLGRAPSESEVRLAHFLGLGGATRLIQAAADNPGVSVKELLPKAYAHNRGLLSESGKPMTAAQAVASLDARYSRDVAPLAPKAPAPVPATLVAQLAEIAPAAAPPAPLPASTPEAAPEPVPAPVQVAAAEEPPKQLACETTVNGVRCLL